jgi:hypothetical protein
LLIPFPDFIYFTVRLIVMLVLVLILEVETPAVTVMGYVPLGVTTAALAPLLQPETVATSGRSNSTAVKVSAPVMRFLRRINRSAGTPSRQANTTSDLERSEAIGGNGVPSV